MNENDKIHVCAIPSSLLGEMWPHVGPLLLRGQLELTPDIHAAIQELLKFIMLVHTNHAQCWSIIDEADGKVVAALITELVTLDGTKFVWVSRMAGEQIMKWGKPLSEAMADFAKQEGASAVRFHGRTALLKAYAGVRIIEDKGDGHHIFERAVA